MEPQRIRSESLSGLTGRRTGRRRPARVAVALALALVVVSPAACSESSSDEPASEDDGGNGSSTVTVSAAASLTDVFTEIADDLMADDPSVEVQLNFGSSAELVAQIEQGAPVDVAAFANTETMDSLGEASLAVDPQLFATNRLAIVTAPGNPHGVATLADLSRVTEEGGVVALCAKDAPCGKFADEVLDRASVSLPIDWVTRATNARSTLSAVSEGDADAAIVYVTDAASAPGAVEMVVIPDDENVVAEYPIAVLADAGSSAAAERFVAAVLSDEGRAVLESGGFGPP